MRRVFRAVDRVLSGAEQAAKRAEAVASILAGRTVIYNANLGGPLVLNGGGDIVIIDCRIGYQP